MRDAEILRLVALGFPGAHAPTLPLGSAEQGRIERDRLEKVLADSAPGAVLAVDLRRTKLINYAFADECFGVLLDRLRAGEHPDRFLVLVASEGDLSDPLMDVHLALARRDLAALSLEEPEAPAGSTGVTGGLGERLREALREVRPGDTNETLAEKLGVKPTACANRTDKLARMRLIRRGIAGGGPGYKRYEFAPVLPVGHQRP